VKSNAIQPMAAGYNVSSSLSCIKLKQNQEKKLNTAVNIEMQAFLLILGFNSEGFFLMQTGHR
jgi:hypothetical protein